MIDLDNINSASRLFTTDEELNEARVLYQQEIEDIKQSLNSVGGAKYDVGLKLIRMYESENYSSVFGWIFHHGCSNGESMGCTGGYVFSSECEKRFGLDKSQVSRYMNIVDEFGDRENGFKDEWKDYSYSQLVELLPLSADERKKVEPTWTIKQIRDYKKRLVATSQQVENVDKPACSVATSQQDKEAEKVRKARDVFMWQSVDIPVSDDQYDFSQYYQFRWISLKALLDRLIAAEAELKEYKAKYDAAPAETVPSTSSEVYAQ